MENSLVVLHLNGNNCHEKGMSTGYYIKPFKHLFSVMNKLCCITFKYQFLSFIYLLTIVCKILFGTEGCIYLLISLVVIAEKTKPEAEVAAELLLLVELFFCFDRSGALKARKWIVMKSARVWLYGYAIFKRRPINLNELMILVIHLWNAFC